MLAVLVSSIFFDEVLHGQNCVVRENKPKVAVDSSHDTHRLGAEGRKIDVYNLLGGDGLSSGLVSRDHFFPQLHLLLPSSRRRYDVRTHGMHHVVERTTTPDDRCRVPVSVDYQGIRL